MEIRREDIVIRDMRPSDIADHLRWRTVETEWMNWDAPWQQDPSLPASVIERRLRELASAPLPAVRTRFEIALSGGEHIGWMNSYLVDGQPGCTAIGIDIPDPRLRGCGRGERAFSAFIHYLFSAGLPCVYTETWSGNLPMIRLAGKCGFSLVQRGRQDRLVDGRPYDSLLFCVTPGDFYKKQTFEPTPNLKKPLSRCGWALFALVLCAQAGAFPLALLLQRFFPDFLHSAAGPFALSAFALYGLGLGAFALVLRRQPAPAPAPVERPGSGFLLRLLVLCLGMGYLGQLAGSTVITFLEKLLGHSYSNALDGVLGGSDPAVIFLFTVVLAPVFEELIFRRMLLRRLLPYGEEFAIGVSAVAFALFHCNIGQMFYAYSAGLILAYAVVSTGRLHVSILLHGCFNLIGSLLMPALLASGNQTAIVLASLCILALMAGSVLLFTHGRGRVHLQSGSLPLSDGQKRRLLARAPGAVAFLLLCLGLTVWTFYH